jgi:surface protein
MQQSEIQSDTETPANTGNGLFSMVPSKIIEKIVALVADGKADKAEAKLTAIENFSAASRATREASMGIMGYIMSLAPVRAVSTGYLLARMINGDFAREVLATAMRDGTALMPRIADLAADSKGAPVADALLKRLSASMNAATVNGAPMYGPAELLDAHIMKIVERLKQKKRFTKPEVSDYLTLGSFIDEFLRLPTDKRVDHMRTYGPMCLWDVSHVPTFYYACARKLLTASPPTFLTFNSDLFWDTSAATDMTTMFANNSEFRGDLSTWDVRNVTKMTSTFSGAGITDSGIGSWDVRSLEDATRMFSSTLSLSPDLDFSLWNMRNCKKLSFMFLQSAIQDNKIGEWTLHRDANTTDMLRGAASFRGNLLKWEESHRNAASIPPRPSFGTKRTARSAQQAAKTDIRKLFAKALSAQGREQKKEKGEKKEPEATCAMQ